MASKAASDGTSHSRRCRRRLALGTIGLQEITEAAQGDNARVGANQFLAQAVDVNLDGVRAHVVIYAEHPLRERVLVGGLAGAQGEGLQHGVLAWRQREWRLAYKEPSRADVVAQVAAYDLAVRLAGRAA